MSIQEMADSIAKGYGVPDQRLTELIEPLIAALSKVSLGEPWTHEDKAVVDWAIKQTAALEGQ